MFSIGRDLKEGRAHATVDKTACERERLWEDSIYITTEEHSKYCYRIMESVLSDRALTAKIRDLFVPRYTTLPSGTPVIVNDFTDAYSQFCLDKYGVQECAEQLKGRIKLGMEGGMERDMEGSTEDDMEGSIEDDMEGNIEDDMEGT
ncbi:hypothetical protein OESDEN_20141, partial [Oesophagostomum dentatum]